MGRRDTYTRPYIADKQRFAELINVNIYGGKEIVKKEMLTDLRVSYPSLGSPKGEKRRDILMEHSDPKIRYGIELETEQDYSMPERIMLYDAGEYETQIGETDRKYRAEGSYKEYVEKKSRMKKEDRLTPVISVVLYLGAGKWGGPCKLTQMLAIPAEVVQYSRKYLQDYQVCIIEADFVKPELYHTELREFFQALQCRNDRGKLRKLLQSEKFQNISYETEMAIAANLNLEPLIRKVEEEEKPMCKAFEELMMEQEEIGIEKGKSVGIKALIETCKELGESREETESRIILKLALSPEEAANYMNCHWNAV